MCLKPERRELKCRVTSGEIMKKKSYWQCSECGEVHYMEIFYQVDSDDIYKTFYCEQCGTETKQLWCGESILDYYELYDVTKDSRYY